MPTNGEIKFYGWKFNPRAKLTRSQTPIPLLRPEKRLWREMTAYSTGLHINTEKRRTKNYISLVIYSVYITTYKSFAIQKGEKKKACSIIIHFFRWSFLSVTQKKNVASEKSTAEMFWRNLWVKDSFHIRRAVSASKPIWMGKMKMLSSRRWVK